MNIFLFLIFTVIMNFMDGEEIWCWFRWSEHVSLFKKILRPSFLFVLINQYEPSVFFCCFFSFLSFMYFYFSLFFLLFSNMQQFLHPILDQFIFRKNILRHLRSVGIIALWIWTFIHKKYFTSKYLFIEIMMIGLWKYHLNALTANCVVAWHCV